MVSEVTRGIDGHEWRVTSTGEGCVYIGMGV